MLILCYSFSVASRGTSRSKRSTMFMDVVTNFGSKGAPFLPTQADDKER